MSLVIAALVFLFGMTSMAEAQDDFDVFTGWRRYSDVRNALYNTIAKEAYGYLNDRERKLDGLDTKREWEEYAASARKRLARAFGPFPKRTPLNATVTGTFEHEGITVENILFESRPGFLVTTSLFRRADLSGKLPVVVYVCGHTADGYKSETYQHVILNLARKGIAVLAVDPVGQGERILYYDSETGKSSIGGPTSEHSYAGLQYLPLGRTMAMVRTWDCMRAVDYLCERQDIDDTKIGVHGRSGGGTMSAFLGAMDERITAAAPECYITSFTRIFESIGPQDAEQNLLGQISSGLDHGDFLVARLPKPTLVVTTTRDFFSIQGARETVRSVTPAFRASGEEDNIGMIEDDAPHQSTKRNRERVYGFFMNAFGVEGSTADEDIPPLDPSRITVTESGQILTSGSKTVHDLIMEDAEPIFSGLEKRRSGEPVISRRETVKRDARELSGYRDPGTISENILAGRFSREGYVIEKRIIDADSDIPLPSLVFIPDGGGRKPAVLYLSQAGKAADAAEGGVIEAMVKSGRIVLACDLPGFGELTVDVHNDDSVIRGVSYNIVFGTQLIGESVTGMQAGSITRAVEYLSSRDDVKAGSIATVARGITGPALLHAAAFDERIAAVSLAEAPVSWESVVRKRIYDQAIGSTIVPSALLRYDLPDLMGVVSPRPLLVIDPLDGDAGPAETGTKGAVERVVRPYFGTSGDFQVKQTSGDTMFRSLLIDWLAKID